MTQSNVNRYILLLLLSIIGGVAWSLLVGQDINWDLLNYHYYDPYAILNGRLGFDIAPAQVQTYFNPVIDIIPYLTIQYFSPWAVGAILGGWHGINFWLVYLISSNLFSLNKIENASKWGIACAIVAIFDPVTVSEIGTMLHDLTVSVFILGSILLVLVGAQRLDSKKNASGNIILAIAGLLIGISVGLKLTTAIYAVGIVAASLFTSKRLRSARVSLILFSVGACFGFLVIDGFWLYDLWVVYGNPMFPMFNEIFKSPYAEITSMVDSRFIPKTYAEWIFFPFMFTLGRHAGMEVPFQDIRIAVYMCLLGIAALALPYQYIFNSVNIGPCKKIFKFRHWSALWLTLFIIFTYLVWLQLFAVYRYMVCLNYLAPAAILLLLNLLFSGNAKYFKYVSFIIMLSIVIFMRAPDFGHLSWKNSYFGVKPPVINHPDKTLIIMSSTDPISFVIPTFPKNIRFVRLESNFNGPSKKNRMFKKIQEILSQYRDHGYIYLITTGANAFSTNKLLREYGTDLGVFPLECDPLPNRIRNDLIFCPVVGNRHR